MQMEQEYKYYSGLASRLKEEQTNLERSISTISTMRMASFLIALILVLIGVSDKHDVAAILGAVIFVFFLYLIYRHSKVYAKMEYVDNALLSAERYVERFGEGWRSFADNGEQFLTAEDVVAHDVDLLGPNSLYQMINVCHTDLGKQYFSDGLKLKEFGVIHAERGSAIAELCEKKDFAVDFEAAGMIVEKTKRKPDISKIKKHCGDKSVGLLPSWCKFFIIILPLMELTFLVLWIAGVVNYGLPLAGFIFNLAFAQITKSVTEKVMSPVSDMSRVVEGYKGMMELLGQQEFKVEYLKKLQETVAKETGAIQGFKQLSKIVQAYNFSFNPLVHQILSGLVLWDYMLAVLVSKWKKRYGEALCLCFDVIAEFEMLLSLSVIGNVRKCSYAHVEDEANVYLKGENLYHPLIKPDAAVANSVSLKGGVTIITGSNMSGKTTFLRTIAINLVLAYIGAPVCAERLSAGRMKLFTSMRITDDIAGGISTFYAEILRIKAMAEFKKQKLPMMCLIDEIFKGTNSADRIVGAKHVITSLGDGNCITVVSTHDFELCTLKNEAGQEAENYHFEEYYEDGQLRFDYKIKSGRCMTTNAREILRLAGFDIQN
ncbi:MAG: DNA mismatch repair protein MutS [Clostridium sp.]|nr:DNA mismatch repair protein MutS [Clostridium sp.]